MPTYRSPDPVADITLRVQPRAAKEGVTGWRDGVLQVRVAAPPVEGAANKACQRLLARLLDVAPSRVTLVAGEQAREKRFRVAGLTQEAAQAKIDAHLGSSPPAHHPLRGCPPQLQAERGD